MYRLKVDFCAGSKWSKPYRNWLKFEHRSLVRVPWVLCVVTTVLTCNLLHFYSLRIIFLCIGKIWKLEKMCKNIKFVGTQIGHLFVCCLKEWRWSSLNYDMGILHLFLLFLYSIFVEKNGNDQFEFSKNIGNVGTQTYPICCAAPSKP